MLHLLVNSPFLPVVTEEKVFKGIITRKELLKAVNFMVHELERRNILTSKTEGLKETINLLN
ncbi:hypothetical protein K4E_18530 [Enterococcus thailandicus]|nr:hypothetical protein K4E_18530 [Enterococcus thailandicus]